MVPTKLRMSPLAELRNAVISYQSTEGAKRSCAGGGDGSARSDEGARGAWSDRRRVSHEPRLPRSISERDHVLRPGTAFFTACFWKTWIELYVHSIGT